MSILRFTGLTGLFLTLLGSTFTSTANAQIDVAPQPLQPQPVETVQDIKGIDQALGLKKISDIDVSIKLDNVKAPENRFAESLGADRSFVLPSSSYGWVAPDIRYQPLYFEEPGLSRYGQSRGCYAQPVMSGAHFFNRVLTLPFHALSRSPFSCDYPLGYHRPGNCNPYLHYQLPW